MMLPMQEEKIEGIVLRAQDYKERHRIITLFSSSGLLSLIVRGISRKNARLLSLTTPFCHGEYLFRRGRTELFNFVDGSVLDDHFSLRQSLASLNTAGALANAILTSQLPGKSSPHLFSLYKSYHKQVVHFEDSNTLLSSFYLKLLHHEGLLSPSEVPPHFSSHEWQLVLSLGSAQQFSSLRTLTLTPQLPQKINALFKSSLKE